MSPLEWIKLFAGFASLAPEIVDQFADKHPELREAPKPDRQQAIRSGFDKAIEDKFGDDD